MKFPIIYITFYFKLKKIFELKYFLIDKYQFPLLNPKIILVSM